MSFMRSVVGALRARPSLVLGVELADWPPHRGPRGRRRRGLPPRRREPIADLDLPDGRILELIQLHRPQAVR